MLQEQPRKSTPPNVRETFSEPVECSRNYQGNTGIMEMLVTMKKEMEEREKMWEQQQRIREEFLEAEFRRKEKRCEQLLKQRDEEMERRERINAKARFKDKYLLQ